MRIHVTASDGSEIYSGDIDDMPTCGYFVDIFEEAVNMRMPSGKTENGWAWSVGD